jgi:hypothetical protein
MNSTTNERPRTAIAPLLLNEAVAATILDESEQTRRIRRYEDQKRLIRGEPIQGPAWIRDGKKRIKYRMSDLQAYVDCLPSAPMGQI